jgi:serine/threonine protein kinase
MSAPREAPPAKRPPEPFGKYILLDRIGVGGMAEVFQGIVGGPEGFQRSLVIKRMLPQLSHDEAFVRMFIDEAKLSGLLAHPNLVQIFEFGQVDESFFIAMEHVHGRTLASVMSKVAELGREMPIDASVEIVRQICVGLQYAHSLKGPDGKNLGIVHRDISPPNLMLGFHGVVKILDFGIARVAEGLRESRTQVGTMKGKISYMSPEQLQLAEIDHRSDIFAVGIILHEMLTGRRLFRSTTDYTSSRMVMELAIPTPSLQNGMVPPALDRIVMRALERNRDLRYATAGEMASDLEQVIAEMRYSPREHTKLLHELFPDEALLSSENALSMSGPIATTSLSMIRAGEKQSSYPSHGALSQAVLTAPGAPAFTGSRASIDLAAQPLGASGRRMRLIVASAALAAVAVAIPVSIRLTRRPEPTPATPAAAEEIAPVKIAPTVVHFSFDSNPQESLVTRVDTGQVIGKTPVTATVPQAAGVITFRFEKTGYKPSLYKAIPDLDKVVRVDLVPLVAEGASEPAHAPAPGRPPIARKAVRPGSTVPASTHRPATEESCWLTVGSSPWAELWIDGRDSGQPTPVVRMPVTCGAHKLRFKRGGDPSIDEAVSITVSSGREFKQNFQLAGGDSDG